MSVPQRFNKSKYKNWLKCMNAFIILKEGLHPFIDTEVKTLHTNIKQYVLPLLNGSNGTIQCKYCSSNDIVYQGATGRNSDKWMIKCPSSVCDVWLRKILAFHTEPDKRSINWKNSDIAKWDTDPYEIAKVFMPKGLDRTTKLPEELDIPAILSLLKYCTYFLKNVPNTRLLTDLIDVRNRLYHSGSFKVADAEKDKWIDMMSQLVLDLNLPVTVHNDLCMLKAEEISIKFEEMETRALMNMVTLQQGDIKALKHEMACMQESQSQLSIQTQNNMDDTSDTRMKTETLEQSMKEMKTILIELTKQSDKIGDFVEKNDIKDKDILGVVGSNKNNINELRSRQYEVEENISDIKRELSSVKEQVGKYQEDTTHQFDKLGDAVEKNERKVKRNKQKQRIWRWWARSICSYLAFLFIGREAGFYISFCFTTLHPIIGDRLNGMIVALITIEVTGLFSFGYSLMHIFCKNQNGSKLRRRLLRYCPLLFCCLWIICPICVLNADLLKNDEDMNGLTEKIERTYVGVLPAAEPFSAAFDSFQIENKCCGVKDYTDFHNATKWNRTSTSTNDSMMIPPSCCKMKPGTHQPRSALCTIDGSKSNKDKPCWDHIKGKYNDIVQFVRFASVLEAIIFMIFTFEDSGFKNDKNRCCCIGNNYQRV